MPLHIELDEPPGWNLVFLFILASECMIPIPTGPSSVYVRRKPTQFFLFVVFLLYLIQLSILTDWNGETAIHFDRNRTLHTTLFSLCLCFSCMCTVERHCYGRLDFVVVVRGASCSIIRSRKFVVRSWQMMAALTRTPYASTVGRLELKKVYLSCSLTLVH